MINLSVENMEIMFGDAVSFNQDINNWDVSNVTNMENMFGCAISLKNYPNGIKKIKY